MDSLLMTSPEDAAHRLRVMGASDIAGLVEFLVARLDEDLARLGTDDDDNRGRRTVEAHRVILDGYLTFAMAAIEYPWLGQAMRAWRGAVVEIVGIYSDHVDYQSTWWD